MEAHLTGRFLETRIAGMCRYCAVTTVSFMASSLQYYVFLSCQIATYEHPVFFAYSRCILRIALAVSVQRRVRLYWPRGSEPMKEILQYLKTHGERLSTDIAEATGISLAAVCLQLAELAAKFEVVAIQSDLTRAKGLME